MPDLKSELSKVLQSWDEPTPTKPTEPTMTLTQADHDKRVTNNISKITFNYVRDNPNINREKAVADLTALGFKKESVSSLISQMVRNRMMALGDHNTLTTTIKEYEPIKQAKKVRKLKAKPKATPSVIEVSVSDPVPVPVPVIVSEPEPIVSDPVEEPKKKKIVKKKLATET
jgi:hypothetical protein